MKALNRNTFILASLLALAALLAFTAPAFAEGEPPPEAPAAPLAAPALAAAPDAASPTAVPDQGAAAPLTVTDLPFYTGGDPQWKVGSQLYATVFTGDPCPTGTTLGVSCWESSTPIAEALTRIEGQGLVPSDRYLYILASATSYPDTVTIDGSVQPNLAQLKGIIGQTVQDGVPDVTLQGRILIQGMAKGFYLKGLNLASTDVTNGIPVYINENAGLIKLEDMWIKHTLPNGVYGLYITSTKIQSVELNRVRVDGNPDRGAVIYSGNYATSGYVKIANSSFNNNQGTDADDHGLKITSNQPITINGVSASGNNKDGIRIDRFGVVDTKPSTIVITNSSFSGSVTGSGLYINYAYGSVTIDNVLAIDNASQGIHIRNEGNVTLKNATINDNDKALVIDTCDDDTVACTYRGTGHVSLTNLALDTNLNGLEVDARGMITVSQVDAFRTQAYLSNQYGDGAVSVQYFDSHAAPDDGLAIYASGAVTLKAVEITDASLLGIYINNSFGSGDVSILGGKDIQNLVQGTQKEGLDILTNGSISIANMVVQNTGGPSGRDFGARLDNDDLGLAKKITITSSAFNKNNSVGLLIHSLGAITLKGIQAYDNGIGPGGSGDGIRLVNTASVSLVAIGKNGSITNYFGGNEGDALHIETQGQVAISDLSVDAGDGFGIFIKRDTSLTKTISLANIDVQSCLGGGIEVQNNGAISLKNVTADGNGDSSHDAYGVKLDNDNHSNTAAISYMGGSVSKNDKGLSVVTDGAITLANLAVNANTENNDHTGASLDNDNAGLPQKVTIIGSQFNDNGGYGLYIRSLGAIVITSVAANDNLNGHDGAYLINIDSLAGTRISKSEFSNNSSTGLYCQTQGQITLDTVTADNNTLDGINIVNSGLPGAPPPSISAARISTSGNGGNGTSLLSVGSVTVNTMVANFNDGTGLVVNNSLGSAKVTVLNAQTSLNDNHGVVIYSNNAILMDRVTAMHNGSSGGPDYSGTYLYTGVFTVTIKNSTFSGNNSHGIEVVGGSSLTISNTNYMGNLLQDLGGDPAWDVYWH